MKILFITSSSINGGAQKHIREMFKSLENMGHDMHLVAPTGWLTDELKCYGDKVITMEIGPKNIGQIEAALDQIKPDITNTFILSGGVFGTVAWKKKKYGKLFITVNNPVIYPGISTIGKLVYPRMYRWMSKYASAFLVKADKVKDEVVDVIRGKKNVVSIKNGIDFTVFDRDKAYPNIRTKLGIKEGDIVLTNVAALDRRKGQQYLIQAATELHKSFPVHILLVGEGSDEERLKEISNAHDGNEYIHFLGRRGDINIVLSNSDIFVLSSLHEGLPNALMEAMAMGLPCVATDVGGVRQLIEDNVDGLVIKPESYIEIKESVEWLLDNPAKKRTYGELAYKKVRQLYNQEKVAEELVAIYSAY